MTSGGRARKLRKKFQALAEQSKLNREDPAAAKTGGANAARPPAPPQRILRTTSVTIITAPPPAEVPAEGGRTSIEVLEKSPWGALGRCRITSYFYPGPGKPSSG